MTAIETVAVSKLKLSRLFFPSMQFMRKENGCDSSAPLKISVKRLMEPTDHGEHKITLSVTLADVNDSINIAVSAVGVFFLEDAGKLPDEQRTAIMRKNTAAIMFPYIRSQISLLTTQPDFPPVVLPPMNIDALIEGQNKEV